MKGKKEVLIEGTYYDVTEWSKHHPGGKVINYYTESGEDASLPFQQFHNRSMKKVIMYRNTLQFRESNEQGERRNQELTLAFKKLNREFQSQGLFNPSLAHVISRVLEFLFYSYLAFVILRQVEEEEGISIWAYLLRRSFGILMLACSYWRGVWMGHEGGHYSLTGSPRVDTYIQKFCYGFGNGLSASWWNHNHHKHHAMPQRIHRDVDLETLPLIAFTSKIFKGNKYTNSFFIRYQSILFLPLQTFIVNLRWTFELHPKYCFYKRQYFESLSILLHFLYASQIGLLNFLIGKWLWSLYMFGNFSLNHTHLPVAEGPLNWVEYALVNTINVRSSLWMDYWMGYLNFQIEHHLFPTMPQFRMPLIQERVRKFAEQNGLLYREVGYVEAIRVTLQNLEDVAKECCVIKE